MQDSLRHLLWRLFRGARNGAHRLCVEQRMRALAVLVVIGTVWLLIYGIAETVLLFLEQEEYAPLKAALLRSLLGLFFFALFFLVALSNALVIWSALFRTRAALFQAQLPVSNRALYWNAAIEGGVWAGWAALVLSVPLVVALGGEALERWRFIAAALAVLLGFLLVCMAAGALGAVLLARLIPVLRRGWRGLVILAAAATAMLIVVAVGSFEGTRRTETFLTEVMDQIGFVHNPFLPPSWAQRAMESAGLSVWDDWAYFLGLLVLTAATLALAGEWIGVRRLRRDLDLLCGRGDGIRRGRSRAWRRIPFLPGDLSILVAKDLRLFLRDPAQIIQFALFFGMLAFYILLLPRIGRAFLAEQWWTQAVSLLNMTAVSMALATFTGRFVYPLLSLEGRRLWVLILAPWDRTRVVTGKFAFALLVGVPISVLLVTLSGTLLELAPRVVLYQAYVTVCMGLGLSAAALGIGARLADYGEDNPAKLVAGYGGTVNLLASLLFALLLLLGAAAPLTLRHGPWGWVIGIGWVTGTTAIWTLVGLRVAWTWFGRDAGADRAPAAVRQLST